MAEKETVGHAREDLREGKAPTAAAGEFVREEIHHSPVKKDGARSRALAPEKAFQTGAKAESLFSSGNPPA